MKGSMGKVLGKQNFQGKKASRKTPRRLGRVLREAWGLGEGTGL